MNGSRGSFNFLKKMCPLNDLNPWEEDFLQSTLYKQGEPHHFTLKIDKIKHFIAGALEICYVKGSILGLYMGV